MKIRSVMVVSIDGEAEEVRGLRVVERRRVRRLMAEEETWLWKVREGGVTGIREEAMEMETGRTWLVRDEPGGRREGVRTGSCDWSVISGSHSTR